MVSDIVAAVKEVKPNIKVNTHIVPWRKDDFGNARERVAGQDIAEFAKYADYVSPMCYSFMLKREPEWIGEFVTSFNAEAPNKVLPSIQIKEAYIEKSITGELFEKCLRESLGEASQGVVLWAWDALDAEPNYKQIMKKVVGETRK